MKTLTIGWLNKCRCGNKSHTVKTARGNNAGLWDDDAVKCNSCGRGGVIQVCEGQARVLWETDEEMAEGKPMSKITKERIEPVIERLEHYATNVKWTNVQAAKDMLIAVDAMRRLLASLEAEPVGCDACGGNGSVDIDHGEMGIEHIECAKCYTASPEPVSVPDFGALTKCIVQRLVDYGAADDDAIARAEEFVYNACRAAMLQGAEPVTTANKLPFEQWLSQQTGTIDVECGCVMTEVFFHWLRVAYEAGNSPVIPDGWVILPAEPTQAMMNAWLSEVANWRGHAAGYRAMIAAAPQQEAKNV